MHKQSDVSVIYCLHMRFVIPVTFLFTSLLFYIFDTVFIENHPDVICKSQIAEQGLFETNLCQATYNFYL